MRGLKDVSAPGSKTLFVDIVDEFLWQVKQSEICGLPKVFDFARHFGAGGLFIAGFGGCLFDGWADRLP